MRDFLLVRLILQQGDEIFLTYGALPNRQLLSQFGFLLPDDAKAAADSSMASSNAPFVDVMAAAAAAADGDGGGGGGGGSEGLAAAAEALCAAGVLQRAAPGGPPLKQQKVGPLLQEACAALGVGYDALLQDALGAFPSSLEDDLQQQQQQHQRLRPRQRLGLDFRVAMKAMLRDEILRVTV
jgi:hypothetical protein